jgi:hypothetical protein
MNIIKLSIIILIFFISENNNNFVRSYYITHNINYYNTSNSSNSSISSNSSNSLIIEGNAFYIYIGVSIFSVLLFFLIFLLILLFQQSFITKKNSLKDHLNNLHMESNL